MRLRSQSEQGSALIVVLAMSGILSLLVTVSFTLAHRSIRVADAEEETHASLAAAEAGIDDYMFRLNSVDEYWNYSATNLPPDGNQAFTQFVPLPGAEDADAVAQIGEFTYTVDTDLLATTGVIQVTATGCAPGPCSLTDPADAARYRTVQASMKQESFLDYLYFTDFETQPPLTYGNSWDIQWADDNCHRHLYDGRDPGCVLIYWGGNDRLNGPFHTNDRFQLNGNAIWRELATSSDTRTPPYNLTGGAVPTFEGGLEYRQPLRMPPSNAAIKVEADPALGGDGCLFTGPTQIVLRNNGTMDVKSPHSRVTGACGTFSGSTTQVRNITIPPNGVVYVQALPTSSSDPNWRAGCITGAGNGLGYPWRQDAQLIDAPTYGDCRSGDAFVEGTLNGRLTIATSNNIYITWHLDYQSGSNSMLGLISNDFTMVYHPIGTRSNGTRQSLNAGPLHTGARLEDVRINAAILAVNGSFMVQNWALGRTSGNNCDPLDDIILTGAIAQVFRGPVGTGTGGGGVCTGYDKNYNYDARLRFTNPPSFIDPLEASWGVSRFAEQFN